MRVVVIETAVHLEAQALRSPTSSPLSPLQNMKKEGQRARCWALGSQWQLPKFVLGSEHRIHTHTYTHTGEQKRTRLWAHLTEWVHLLTRLKRLFDKPASTWRGGWYSVVNTEPEFPAATQPLPTRMVNALHLAGGIRSGARHYRVARVWPLYWSREGSTPGRWKVGPGWWWKVCIILLLARGCLCQSFLLCFLEALFVVGKVFVYYWCYIIDPQWKIHLHDPFWERP